MKLYYNYYQSNIRGYIIINQHYFLILSRYELYNNSHWLYLIFEDSLKWKNLKNGNIIKN